MVSSCFFNFLFFSSKLLNECFSLFLYNSCSDSDGLVTGAPDLLACSKTWNSNDSYRHPLSLQLFGL